MLVQKLHIKLKYTFTYNFMLLGKCSRYIQYALQIAQDSQENLCTYKKSLKIFNMDRVALALRNFSILF